MGRININFHVAASMSLVTNVKADAVPAKDLALVLLNLPGITHITGCVTGMQNPSTLYTENTVEALNDILPDGTEIEVKYVQHQFSGPNGQVIRFHNYDGFIVRFPNPSAPNKVNYPGFMGLPAGAYGSPASTSPGQCGSGHNWVTYNGFNTSYDYCKTCGATK